MLYAIYWMTVMSIYSSFFIFYGSKDFLREQIQKEVLVAAGTWRVLVSALPGELIIPLLRDGSRDRNTPGRKRNSVVYFVHFVLYFMLEWASTLALLLSC